MQISNTLHNKPTNVHRVEGTWLEIILLMLLLIASLLTQVKASFFNYAVHNILIPLFAGLLLFSRRHVFIDAVRYHRKTITVLAILYLWIWIVALLSEHRDTAIKYTIKYSNFPLIFISYLVLYFRNHNSTIKYRVIHYFLLGLSIFGLMETIMPGLTIFQIMRPFNFLPRIASLMQNPNPFGALMSLAFILSFLLWRDRILAPFELLPALLLFGLSVFLSGSRNALFVLSVSISLLIYLYRDHFKNRAIVTRYGILGISILSLFSIYFLWVESQSVKSIMDLLINREIAARWVLFKGALRQIIQHPITGIGVEVFTNHVGTELLGREGYHTHNLIMNVAVDIGLVGLLLSSLLFYNLCKTMDLNDLKVTLSIGIILLSQIFDYYFHDYTYPAVAFCLLAIAANSKNESQNESYLAV